MLHGQRKVTRQQGEIKCWIERNSEIQYNELMFATKVASTKTVKTSTPSAVKTIP